MNFINRLQGVFFSPKDTLKAISEKPVWVDTMIILLVVIMIFSFIILPYAKQDQIQVLKSNVELQERLGEEAYQRQLEFLENPPKWFFFIFTIIGPFFVTMIGFFLPPLILLAFGRMFSTEGNYKQTLSVYLHASLVDRIIVFERQAVNDDVKLGEQSQHLVVIVSVEGDDLEARVTKFLGQRLGRRHIVIGDDDLFKVAVLGQVASGLFADRPRATEHQGSHSLASLNYG